MIKNVFKGIKAYAGTLQLISKLGLWKYFGIPILISIITAISIGFAAWGLSDNIANVIDTIWFWEWGAETFHKIGEVLGGAIVIVIGLILYKHIIMALSSPFMSPVSIAIEKHLLGDTPHTHIQNSNVAQLWRGIQVNVRNLGFELFFTIPLIILSFIPVLNIFSTILIFIIQSYYAGFGNMDYTLERHLSYKDSVSFVRSNSGVAIGNGIVFMAMLFIPVVGIILVLPLSVTASTTETVRIIQQKKITIPKQNQ